MKKLNMKVNIAGVELKNPVTTASGTFGSGKEYCEYVDLNRLGAIAVNAVTEKPCKGNPTPRIVETYGGILNAVGLQNPGVEEFIRSEIPFIRAYDTKIIVNVSGRTVEEYCSIVERLSSEDVDIIELNISCPNVKEGGVFFGTDVKMTEHVTREVKKYAKQPLMVKLTPNVTHIGEIAKAAVSGGADALSLINTIMGMAIDVHRRKPILPNIIGGFSGPAVKPVAVRMVYQVAQAVDVPIIGMGGIMSGEDAVEFILAGATAIAVGTTNFINPRASMDVLEGIEKYLLQNKIEDVNSLIGNILV